ncbi:M50 family metallopeptidase [Acidobacteriota bacterium]
MQKKRIIWLITASVITIILWQINPWGHYILYPFTILATWFHEMFHGLAALLMGGHFHKLELFPNGSGTAYHSGSLYLRNLGRAFVAGAGPLGPVLAGSIFILCGRRQRATKICLYTLSIVMFLSVVLWVRTIFGFFVITLLGAVIFLIALKAKEPVQGFIIQFLGVQACVSCYLQLGYLFKGRVVIDGQAMLSDTGVISDQLLAPVWFWGATIMLLSVLILAASLRAAYR